MTYLADQRQGLAARYTYDPYGRVLARSGPVCDGNRMQFSGKECDSSTGLSYYGRRFYSPLVQRWLNNDPEPFNDGLNAFSFVRNTPISAIDPTGEISIIEFANITLIIQARICMLQTSLDATSDLLQLIYEVLGTRVDSAQPKFELV